MSGEQLQFPLGLCPSLEKPEPEWPDWFRPSKYNKMAAKRVAMGRHPSAGAALGPEGRRCGDCKHLYRRGTRAGNVFLKCDLVKATRGPATDIRAKWRSCERFEAA